MKTARMVKIVAVGLALAGLAGQAGGATYVVDPNGFADFNSIQAALDDPCTVDGDEIEVWPGTHYEAIDFGGKGVRLYSSGGAEVTTIDGTGNDHVVKCVSGEDANTILEGFTITGGYADGASWPDYQGAGMYCENSSPTVKDCNFSGNTATQAGGGMLNNWSHPALTNCTFSGNWAGIDGGGIYNYESSPKVTNCTFSYNSAQRGSGMYNYGAGSPTVTDCNFSGNTATNDGAGMYNETSTPTLTNCRFRGNWAGINGGGIFNNMSSPTVTNCRFRSNTAQWGGGLYNYSSSPTVTNCTFSGNTATYSGAGIYNEWFSNPTVTNCIVWGNSPDQMSKDIFSLPAVTYSDVQGGWSGDGNNIDANPLFVNALNGNLHLGPNSPCVDAGDNNSVPADSSDLDGDGNTIEPMPFDLDGNPRFVDDSNVADRGAGTAPIVDMGAYERQMDSAPGVNNAGTRYWTIQDAIDDANDGDEIEVAPGTYAGPIDCNGKGVRLYSSGGPEVTTIDGTGNYHVIQCVSGEDANTIIEGFTITGGVADGASWPDFLGGGMYCENSSPTVTNCCFTGNTAGYGAGIYDNNSSPTVNDCCFTNNNATHYGGGMNNYNGSSPTVTDCNFSGNTAGEYGGGMCNEQSTNPNIADCIFNGNTAGISGGGLYNNNSSPTVTDCNFSSNTTTNAGAGMFNNYANPTVTNCTFSENSASDSGGGIFNSISGPNVTNCAFINNSAQWGGGLYNYDNSNPTVVGCTFSGNSTTGNGGGIMNNSSSNPTVTNCILWGNSPEEIYELTSSGVVTYSDVQGGWSGTGNIDANPLFVDAAGGDLRLRSCSACVDAGDNNSVPADVADLDNDGNTVEPIPFDLGGNARFVDDTGMPNRGLGAPPIVDMGAYERQSDSVGLGTINVPGDFSSIQEAICEACSGDEIVVAPGTYYEAINFNGKAITVRSSDPNDANVVAETIIDGDWNHDHVVKCVRGEDANTVLAGFTITHGYADGGASDIGGGMYCENSSPTVTDCNFFENGAVRHGGGMYNYLSSPTVTNCLFRWNWARRGGGGMLNEGSSPTVTNCTFSCNIAAGYDVDIGRGGGGVFNYYSSESVFIRCSFQGNETGNGGGDYSASGADGGGMYNFASSPRVADCEFIENATGSGAKGRDGDYYYHNGGPGGCGGNGAGMYNYNCSPAVTGCSFIGNVAGDGNDGGKGRSAEFSSPGCGGDGGHGGDGAGICNYAASAVVRDCSFIGNASGAGGGGGDGGEGEGGDPYGGAGGDGGDGAGMYNWESSGAVTGCSFVWNVTGDGAAGGDGGKDTLYNLGKDGGDGGDGGYGAGIWNYNCSPIVTGCVLANNLGGSGGAGGAGGNVVWPFPDGSDGEDGVAGMGVMFNVLSPATVTNSSFYNSSSGLGGSIWNSWSSNAIVTNCIVWGVAGMEMVNVSSSPVVTYSDVKGGTGQSWFGAGCIDENPMFVNGSGCNLRLRGISPCIDAGDNNSVPADSCDLDGDGNTVEPIPFDLDGYPRIIDGDVNGTAVVDMGSYEYNFLVAHNVSQDRLYGLVQDAIDDANDGDEIEVWPGTHYEAIDFGGKGVRLYSSGGAEVTTIDGTGNDHVVKCVSGEDANTILEGFTITGGYADGASWPDYQGAGMYCENSSPTVKDCNFSGNTATQAGGGMLNNWSHPALTNCTFSGNWAGINGGGIYNWESSPKVTNCTFSGNSAERGSGMYNYGSGNAVVTDCNFSENTATHDGAGMYNETSTPTLTNCRFRENWAGINGGGIFNNMSSPTVTNCTFSNNPAQWGGGMYDYDNSSPTVTNCTFSGNTATNSAGGIMNNASSNPTVTNCILWGNSPDQIDDYDYPSSWAAATYSDVQGGYGGTENIDADPCFVTGALGDYYLSQVAAGQALNSPCVDAGSDTAANLGMDESTTRTDGLGDGGVVDMGYHYRLPEAWDLNGDWKVSFIDFGILAEQWQQAPGVPSADIVPPEGDGVVDGLDLGLLVDYWLWQE